jgi:DNA-directed RNA polymerase subunit RPC12/RpoP
MPLLTLHDIASGLGARLTGVECQHCIRRGILTAEALKARRGDSRTLEGAGVRCSVCGSRRFTATRFATRSTAHTFTRNL